MKTLFLALILFLASQSVTLAQTANAQIPTMETISTTIPSSTTMR